MKNIKRLLALFMALAIVLSCTTFASAAEVEDCSNAAVVCNDSGIAPYALGYLTDERYPVSDTNSDPIGTFALGSPQYITLAISSNMPSCLIEVQSRSTGITYSFVHNAGSGIRQQSIRGNLADGRFSDGWYTWKIHFYTSGIQCGFQWLATDYSYNMK